MVTEVFEPGTSNKYIYIGLTPYEAVNTCFEQNNGNYNTWEYSKTLHLVKITKSGLYCYRGDFSARIDKDKIVKIAEIRDAYKKIKIKGSVELC